MAGGCFNSTFFQFSSASSAVVRVDIFGARRLLKDFVMLLLCSCFGRTRLLLCDSSLLDRPAAADTLFAENFLSGVGYLLKNRLW